MDSEKRWYIIPAIEKDRTLSFEHNMGGAKGIILKEISQTLKAVNAIWSLLYMRSESKQKQTKPQDCYEEKERNETTTAFDHLCKCWEFSC